ncbi:hypothetical protein [Micromonospora sp. NPDC049497]|uniref:hypothetical protein n=1 Tax=Micromonospora sp. NPDC049497 TaxID=3364273 RepID=UPI003799ED7F
MRSSTPRWPDDERKDGEEEGDDLGALAAWFPAPHEPRDRETWRVRPHLLPVTMEVLSPVHGEVQVRGFARFFSAHTIHAHRSTVVVGSQCSLQQTDHYHFHRVTISLDQLIQPGKAREALNRLLASPGAWGAVGAFQRALSGLLATEDPGKPIHVTVGVREGTFISATGSDVVSGTQAEVRRSLRFVSEETVIDGVRLLAESPDLVRGLVRHLTDPHQVSGDQMTRAFLSAAGRIDDLDLVRQSADFRRAETRLLDFLGVTFVDRASSVMIGVDNDVEHRVRVHRPGVAFGELADSLDTLREYAEQRLTPDVGHDGLTTPDRFTRIEPTELPGEHRKSMGGRDIPPPAVNPDWGRRGPDLPGLF